MFAILGLWAVTSPLFVIVGEASGPFEFFVGGIFVLGLSATAVIVTFGALRAAGGRPLTNAGGQIRRAGYATACSRRGSPQADAPSPAPRALPQGTNE